MGTMKLLRFLAPESDGCRFEITLFRHLPAEPAGYLRQLYEVAGGAWANLPTPDAVMQRVWSTVHEL